MKETRENMRILLEKVNYNQFKWKICSDLKIVGLLCGLKEGHSKYPCHMCLFDSRAVALHFNKKDWQERKRNAVGKFSVEAMPLIPADRILLPSLHVKLGVMRVFIVAALRENPQLMRHLKDIFKTSKTEDKLSNGVRMNSSFSIAVN